MKKTKIHFNKSAAERGLIEEIPEWVKQGADLPLPALQNLAQLWLFVFPDKKRRKAPAALLLITIWIIITDRFFESRKISQSQLRIFCGNIKRALKNKGNIADNKKMPNASMDFSVRLLAEIFQTLSGQESDQRFLIEWKRSVNNFLRGMLNEKNFSYARPPSLSQYLKNGRQSIGSSAVLYAMALFIFRAPWLKSTEFAIIKKIIKDLSLALRLINDLGSHKRESEHKILNSLAVLMKRGKTRDEAMRIISRLIEKSLANFKQSKKSSPAKCRLFISALDKLLRFTRKLYETKDYHEETPRA